MSYALIHGDALEALRDMPDNTVQCCVTSPPYYGLRNYGVVGQIGNEGDPVEYVKRLTDVFREVRRVMTPEGTLWLNLGDSYAANRGCQAASTKGGPKHSPAQAAAQSSNRVPTGLKPKDLIGIPWRVAFALREDGWYLRMDNIWHKPNPMPESVTDRPTKAHEYMFLLAASEHYYYDRKAILEPFSDERQGQDGGRRPSERNRGGRTDGLTKPSGINPSANGGRNKRSVWTIAPQPYKGAHVAVFPEKLVEPCVLAGCPPGGRVLDPFCGSGTTGAVALRHGRDFTGIDLNADYLDLARTRLEGAVLEAAA